MDGPAELGRDPVSKHHIQPEFGYEHADAGQDCRTRLARPNSRAQTRTGKYSFSLRKMIRAGLATLPGWSILLLLYMCGRTYIHPARIKKNMCTYAAASITVELFRLQLLYNCTAVD